MPGITHYGWAESTAAMRSILSGGVGGVRGTRKRKRRAKKASARKRTKRTKGTKRKAAHLVKGSKAAKTFMAKLRKKAAAARRG